MAIVRRTVAQGVATVTALVPAARSGFSVRTPLFWVCSPRRASPASARCTHRCCRFEAPSRASGQSSPRATSIRFGECGDRLPGFAVKTLKHTDVAVSGEVGLIPDRSQVGFDIRAWRLRRFRGRYACRTDTSWPRTCWSVDRLKRSRRLGQRLLYPVRFGDASLQGWLQGQSQAKESGSHSSSCRSRRCVEKGLLAR